MSAACELFLIRDWDAAWRTVIAPWLREPASLRRDLVVVPTRGQAHWLKRRCVREGIPLLGVEFLTPGLLRRKLHTLMADLPPAMPVEWIRLHLQAIIAESLARRDRSDPTWGFWKSLASDVDRALADHAALQHAGLGASDFGFEPLREAFGELEKRVAAAGFDFAPRQESQMATRPLATPDFGRVLLTGFTAEESDQFSVLKAAAARGESVRVLVPEPDFERPSRLAEAWVQRWERALAMEASVLDDIFEAAGRRVADLWTGADGDPSAANISIGRTREDEVALVARQIVQLLAAGAKDIAVVFPRADAAHRRLAGLLADHQIPFNDLIEAAAPPAPEIQLQAALLRFLRRGTRLEEMLALWQHLQLIGATTVDPSAAREACERAFDETQDHVLEPNRALWETSERTLGREMARVAALLPSAWPDAVTLSDAVTRFAAMSHAFRLPLPQGWNAFVRYAEREPREFPSGLVLEALANLLPSKGAVTEASGRGQFAPVTLTTRRRAAGCAWEHVILMESNAGVWPRRAEPSVWLTDEQREELNRRLGEARLPLAEEQFGFERQGWLELGRNAAHLGFSAALFDEQEPEIRLAPNSWLERVLVARSPETEAPRLEDIFPALALGTVLGEASSDAGVDAWESIWRGRRDPARPFDGHFFSGPLPLSAPKRVAARTLEAGLRDPIILWYEMVLKVSRAEWRPLVRARRKLLGQVVHRVLARALRGPPVEGEFMARPEFDVASRGLSEALLDAGQKWPRNLYWDSIRAEADQIARTILEKVFQLPEMPFLAVEARLPSETMLAVGAAGDRIELAGRIDLVLSDRPGWNGARVAVVDFKTGADLPLSVERMARGDSLQLGLYLAAAQRLGAADGAVLMVKPDAAPPARIAMEELPRALAGLDQLALHRATGRYGALTPDRTEFSRGFEWPLACAAIEFEILERKFARTLDGDASRRRCHD
ncbi:MAG TPA: PD-(D/E)XK nuclease family protein [Candidatus Didemnitutus sp.]|nr:PD-(D/E)XK nuclease family protein [Candidatus Didemnitutus sp.]